MYDPVLNNKSVVDLAFASPSLISGIRDMNHYWYRKEISDHALVSIKVDFETIERGHGIFRCPSELHLDPSYQNIIESTVKKWLIDSQPESEEKQMLESIIVSKLAIEFDLASGSIINFEVAEKVLQCNICMLSMLKEDPGFMNLN